MTDNVGLISVRKAFRKAMRDGVPVLDVIQDVCLSPGITVT
jgi:hypothetical protein